MSFSFKDTIDIDDYRKQKGTKNNYSLVIFSIIDDVPSISEVVGTFTTAKDMVDQIIGQVKSLFIKAKSTTYYINNHFKFDDYTVTNIYFTSKYDSKDSFNLVYRIYLTGDDYIKISDMVSIAVKKLGYINKSK